MPRQKPLEHTCALVPSNLYPHIVRTLYPASPIMAILMWACADESPGALLTAGCLSKRVVCASVVTAVTFLREMVRIGMMTYVDPVSEDPMSCIFTVVQYLCLEVDTEGSKLVYM